MWIMGFSKQSLWIYKSLVIASVALRHSTSNDAAASSKCERVLGKNYKMVNWSLLKDYNWVVMQ